MTAREIALGVVRDVFPANAMHERGAAEALDYRLRKTNLDRRDRAFATELAYGAIKMRRALDWRLDPFIGARAATLPPATREVLRLAIYELAYTRADVHATVFEWVNLARKFGHTGVANLTNAVLRRYLDAPTPDPQPDAFSSEDDYLGAIHSLPSWLVRQWRETFAGWTADICAAVNAPPAAAITANLLQGSAADVRERLAEGGIQCAASGFVPESILVEGGMSRVAEAGGADVAWWTQSESSAMAVDVLNPQPGESIFDVCSGRGNKTLQIAGRLKGEGAIVCLERDERKIETLRRRTEAAGVAVAMVAADAGEHTFEPPMQFDRVLIDAPCSGTGLVARHAESRWKKSSDDGERLSQTQRAILERVSTSVREGGVLVYAVCSTDPRETTEVVRWFLSRHNFERGLVPSAYEQLLAPDGDIVVAPGIEGRDGFFIARLQRR
ncbi:MAG TPA: transcription antitermination factor NusB [Candidatus Tumulicola sp.]|jgi:16S rRNA (cytosine967-C5)-methyltransferase